MSLMLRDMLDSDIDSVLHIEQQVHAHPWTRGNFKDAIASNYLCKLAVFEGKLIGYAVLMQGVDDAELLDIGIVRAYQRQGWGSKLLQKMLTLARDMGKLRVVLEVRASNSAAIGLYRGMEFQEIGLRRDYYPVENSTREDAILMGLKL